MVSELSCSKRAGCAKWSDSLHPFFSHPNRTHGRGRRDPAVKIQHGTPRNHAHPEIPAEQKDKQLREASKLYETHFLNEMVKAMRSTVKRDGGLMQPNFAEKIFGEQLDNQYVEGWANKGGIGLADLIYTQI